MSSLVERWRRRRRDKSGSADAHDRLREFVYLDEVSVYSLIASWEGPVATEYTDTHSSSTSTELEGSGGVNVGVGKLAIGSTLGQSLSSESQVVRKSSIQATFKRLRDVVTGIVSLGRPSVHRELDSAIDLDVQVEYLIGLGWIVDPAELTRGRMLETSVELEAEATFRVLTVVSSFLEMLDEAPQLAQGLDGRSSDALALTGLLDRFLVGLVPVRGRVVEFEAITHAGRELLVHRDVLDRLVPDQGADRSTLYVVGVAEARLFWRDLRRVLFSHSRYRVMCRLSRDGIHDSWTPIKLTDVLDGVAPGFAKQLGSLGDTLLTSIASVAGAEPHDEHQHDSVRAALVYFGINLGSACGVVLDEEALAAADVLSGSAPAPKTAEAARALFAPVANHVSALAGTPIDPALAAELRTRALNQSGIPLVGSTATTRVPLPRAPTASERFVDTEIIAIYW